MEFHLPAEIQRKNQPSGFLMASCHSLNHFHQQRDLRHAQFPSTMRTVRIREYENKNPLLCKWNQQPRPRRGASKGGEEECLLKKGHFDKINLIPFHQSRGHFFLWHPPSWYIRAYVHTCICMHGTRREHPATFYRIQSIVVWKCL